MIEIAVRSSRVSAPLVRVVQSTPPSVDFMMVPKLPTARAVFSSTNCTACKKLPWGNGFCRTQLDRNLASSAIPARLMKCGDATPSSAKVAVPSSVPRCVGAKITSNTSCASDWIVALVGLIVNLSLSILTEEIVRGVGPVFLTMIVPLLVVPSETGPKSTTAGSPRNLGAVVPPVVVRSIFPFSPTASPVRLSVNRTFDRFSDVPLDCGDHVSPPLYVLRIVPLSPTIQLTPALNWVEYSGGTNSPLKFENTRLVSGIHSPPAFLVDSIEPFSPTTRPVSAAKLTEL